MGYLCAYNNNRTNCFRETRGNMEKIKIGKIVNAVALRGEVKIYHYSDYKERFEDFDSIIVEGRKGSKEYEIENIRYQKDVVIAKLKGVDDRTGAENLKESDVFITEEELRSLPEDTFYIRDLIGCVVKDQQSGQVIGTISDVFQNTAQDLYQVELEKGGQALIPAVEQFVKSVDINERTVIVDLIPGLVEGI